MLSRLAVFIWTLRKRLGLIWAILRDKRIPRWKRFIPLLPLLYLVTPLNFMTFAIPVIGQIDDAVILMFSMSLFERLVDDKILQEHENRMVTA